MIKIQQKTTSHIALVQLSLVPADSNIRAEIHKLAHTCKHTLAAR